MTSQTLFIDSYNNAFDTAQFLHQKTQGKGFAVHVTKAYRVTGGTAPLILNLGTR